MKQKFKYPSRRKAVTCLSMKHFKYVILQPAAVAFISRFIPIHEKFLQFDWLRAVVFQLNLKFLHVKITKLLWVVSSKKIIA